jgi:predicted anti-sigma-YlaC factor YlaD
MGQIPLQNCDPVRELISASLDGELSELDGVRLSAHLAGCAGCRTYAAGATESARLLRGTPLEQLNVPIQLPGRRLAVARKLQVAAAAAAVVATAGLSAAVGTLTSSSPHRPQSSVQATKLRFPEQELRMLEQASRARSNLVIHSRIAL